MDEGRVNGQTLVQPEGQTGWHPLSSFPNLATGLPPAPGAAPAPATIRVPSSAVQSNIPNYLVQAILSTICCCVPLGIPAIVYAAQVNSKLADGDIAGAQQASKNARMWCWIALIAGAAATLLYLAFMVMGFFARSGVMTR